MTTKVFLDTLGCKLNQAETEWLASQLGEAGFRLVDAIIDADIYLLNTCSVTVAADAKSRHLLRRAHRLNPDAMIVATGCYAERDSGEVAQIPGVSRVVGNSQKHRLPSIMEKYGRCHSGLSAQETPAPSLRTRSFIKVQEGCRGACTYCIVPAVRKGEKNLGADDVVSEVTHKVAGGVKEVVLTGTEVGAYSGTNGGLQQLLRSVLARTSVPRLRLSSLQPQEISPDLISLWKDERLCPHFHLSLQSGCDDTLHRMKRRYSVDDYVKSIDLIRLAVPEAAITTDVIVGFPGESAAEFQQTYDLCKQLQFARIHVFPYSTRPGTEAADMPHRVEEKIKRERTAKMLDLAAQSMHRFRDSFRGKTRPVLWEKRNGRGVWSGLTDNYIPVLLATGDDLENRIIPTRIE